MEEKVAKVLARKLEEVATKQDLGAVKVEIKAEFKNNMGTLKEYVDLRFDSMDRSLNLLKWLIGLGFFVLTVLISVLGLR